MIVMAILISEDIAAVKWHSPIAFNISGYEQKAVIVLLALLLLGVKNIHVGSTMPAFLSPNVLNYLVENFHIAPVTTPEEDLKVLLKR